MSDHSDDDLPDFCIGNVNHGASRQITQIDVEAEIAENIARKELKQKILEGQIEFEEVPILPAVRSVPIPKISSFPPNRPLFHPDRSRKSFNADTLTTENFCPSEYSTCTSANVDEFFFWFHSKYKNSSDDIKRQCLQYVWLLISIHPDAAVVEKCRDMLIEYNSCWRLTYNELILVFKNWGVSDGDIVSEVQLSDVKAPCEPGPVVSVCNIESVLQILHCQLVVQDLEEPTDFQKSVFILLSLLVLDENYVQCLSDVSACLGLIAVHAESKNPVWIQDYCQGLFQVESHHARLAFLAECVVPECMRWCMCLAYCQQVFSLQQTFQAQPKPSILLSLLFEHMDTILKLESWELYSLMSVVDTGVSQVVSYNTEEKVRAGFESWLGCYMARRPERRTNDVDVDAGYLAELASRLQTEWEANWGTEASIQNISLAEIPSQDLHGN